MSYPSSYTFVTGGVAGAVEQAKHVAGDKVVGLHGATVMQQALPLGLVDEIRVHVIPVLLGDGTPLFASLDSAITLERTRALATPAATHIRFRVVAEAPASQTCTFGRSKRRLPTLWNMTNLRMDNGGFCRGAQRTIGLAGVVELKYLMASRILTGSAFDRGSQPYQDFRDLMKLRNHLAHPRHRDQDTATQQTRRATCIREGPHGAAVRRCASASATLAD